MIRCRQCDHANPEDHRFCGMCGSPLDPVTGSTLIDDRDPLEIENPTHHFENRARAMVQPHGNQPRGVVRERFSRNSGEGRPSRYSSAAIDHLSSGIDEEELPRQPEHKSASGIGGPSFLGLNYDSPNSGFIYDNPKDGFIYDTESQPPEYLLEEIPRGVSWRAWALFLLLLIGAGLGYVQWRASHHQGPDIASILARNGPTVDPSRPVISDTGAKPTENKAENKNASADAAAAGDSSSEVNEDSEAASPAKADGTEGSASAKTAAGAANGEKTNDANSAKPGKAEVKDDQQETDSDQSSTKSPEAKRIAAKPESDGPVAHVTRSVGRKPAVEQAPPAAKSLGDKDPLLVQADKYINGRGAPKNCSRGVNLLREAVSAGNPAASVKLGALYWSGNCVTQSKVTAYEWFSRAHSLEPKNRWIERSRNSLWASMSPAEQRRAGY